MESETTEQLEARAVDLVMGIEDEAAPEDAQDEITDQEGGAEGSEDDALEADSEDTQNGDKDTQKVGGSTKKVGGKAKPAEGK